MTPETLLALTGDVIVAVRAKDKYDLRDLVTIARIAAGMEPYHEDYDLNKDGVIDDTDLSLMQGILYGGEV
ncbi:MAG: hypothetical protein U0M60_01640 [Clostridia bacterium]|nr:hypothetical protein [Clostridia bacterium]